MGCMVGVPSMWAGTCGENICLLRSQRLDGPYVVGDPSALFIAMRRRDESQQGECQLHALNRCKNHITTKI